MKHTFKIFLAFVILAGLFLTDRAFSQCVIEDWISSYDGPGNTPDGIFDMVVDGSGNVYITGFHSSITNLIDIFTIKYDTDGVQQWIATYNGTANGQDVGKAITVDGAGNVYITGYSEGIGTSFDIITIKYNSAGVEQWAERFNGNSNIGDIGESIGIDALGNVYITGRSELDYITIKYNSNGVEQWVATYNGPANDLDEAYSLDIDDDGNILVSGSSKGIGSESDIATIKYNSSGVEQWVARYNGTGNSIDILQEIKVDDSGNVYITGWSYGIGTSSDFATVKYNSSGIEQWVARYNGPANDNDESNSIALDDDGNIYVTGWSVGIGTSTDFTTIKYNSSGVEQWVSRYNGPANIEDFAYSIVFDGQGNLYVTGGSLEIGLLGNDITTIKYNTSGVEQWVARYNGSDNLDDYGLIIGTDLQGNVYVAGISYEVGTGRDVTTIKYPASEASVSNLIWTPGFFNFNTIDDVTAVYMNFINFTGLGNVSVSLYTNAPTNYSLPPELFVSQYRWIICQTGLSDIDALVKIYFPDIPDNGIVNPNSVTVYSRPIPGSGLFTPLPTTLNGDTLIATVTGFSEFILVSTDDPLPVDLISFNASVEANDVTLNWTTAWEENNDRFEIQRRNSESDAAWSTVGSVSGSGTVYEERNYIFTDRNLLSGKYEYRLKQIDFDGNSTSDHELGNIVEIGIPGKYELSQNYPNPFNPVTKINFSLPVQGMVTMKIFDITGREVATLVNEVKNPGYYSIDFNASVLSSGVYFYRLQSADFVDVKRMLMIK